MDFGAAPPILDALAGLSADANFGYLPPFLADELAAACAEFQKRRYGWDTDPALIHHVPDVIKALEIAITRFSRPGSPVILPTPAYMPFLSVPGFCGRDIIQVRMRDDNGFFSLDLDAIGDAFRAGGPGLRRRDTRSARLSGDAPRPVRVHVGGGRGAHPDRHFRLEGMEPARPEMRAGHPHQRG
jgi:bifunctional pyridoxal-dependent enzyme with beta-cystathionase and maltose regulon repressor activities